MQATTAGEDGAIVNGTIQIFDTQGTAHNLSLTFQKQADNTWNMTASLPSTDGTMINSTVTGITFNDNGSFRQVSGSGTVSFQINGLSAPQTVSFNFGSANGFNGLTQFGGQSSAAATNQDGYAAGTLSSVSVAQDGTINGVFTNGQIFPLAQLAIAQFSNPAGLSLDGSNYYSQTINSGLPPGRGRASRRTWLRPGRLPGIVERGRVAVVHAAHHGAAELRGQLTLHLHQQPGDARPGQSHSLSRGKFSV